MQEKIVIAGGGLVGAMAAGFLAQRGFRVEVYERREDLRAHAISAGRSINLALANRGIYALEKLGLMERVSQLLIPMRGRMVHDVDGSCNLQPYGQRPEEVIYSVSRGALNGLLLDAAEASGNVDIFFEQELLDIDFDDKRARFRDHAADSEKHVPFDRFIGADGAGSRARTQLLNEVHREQPDSECREQIEPLDHQYKELEIPAGADGGFLLEREALHIWPRGGFMLIALPNLDGSFTVTLFLPAKANGSQPGFDALQTEAQVENFFRQYFPDAAALMPTLLEDFFRNPCGHLGTVRCTPWCYRDSAVLIGDAAHGIVPFHGQGMNCGFEDCVALDDCIGQTPGNWREIFRHYSGARIPNANAIADMALENYVEMRNSVRDPKFLLKKSIGFELETRFPDHFTPRYAMVMFHRLPYAEAQRKGEINRRILSELADGIDSLEQVDWDRARVLIEELLPNQ
ncbi:kynurenine 3-monooxygenase [Microbulbifer donghaiensis]|uniref:Kynurenine 3-monooxygenase n=1 Tax=Microbulbifer donghaiensis TaxID=494016 RepID=A0A1M5CEY2_9GAMM|nr:NAD(P)/FAD-dependent oxidoreductase [Microbulbifer donghaiensis]SHF53250.1 kynurenine 3-monooxygenase [Microbulbifer donghaiensis]